MDDEEPIKRNRLFAASTNKLIGQTENSLAGLFPPHPKARAADQERLQQQLASLITGWGAREARRMWRETLKAVPAKRGRPPGARTKEIKGFIPWRALQCLNAFANDPKHAGWSRWRVIRAAATFLSDHGGAGAIPDEMFRTYVRERDPKAPNAVKIKQPKERKSAIEAMHMRLTREQEQVDEQRVKEMASLAALYTHPRYTSLFQSVEECAEKLIEEQGKVCAAFPALPQKAEPTHGIRTKMASA